MRSALNFTKGAKLSVELMLIAALICADVIFLQIKKFEKKPENSDDFSKYLAFCDEICGEIERVKDLAKSQDFFKERLSDKMGEISPKDDENLAQKAEFLDKMDNFIKEISFIKSSNANRHNAEIWEQKLFEFLDKFEKFIILSAKNGENLADEIRKKLMKSFVR